MPQTLDPRSLPASFISAQAVDPAAAWNGAPPNFGDQVLPHIMTVSGRVGTKAYMWADEALRDSRANADKMRTDCGIMESVEARQRAVALLNWHIVPEDDTSQDQKALADEMTRIIRRTPHFTKLRYALADARWYGRAGVAYKCGKDWVNGKMRTIVSGWEPRHGDKFVFRYDDGSKEFDPDQIGIRIAGGYHIDDEFTDSLGTKHSQVQATQFGLTYWLNSWQRKLLILNKHIIEDGPWEDPIRAGSIHGVGIRDRIYWTWYGMIESLANVLIYMERSGFGTEIWKYPANNAQAKARAEAAAREVISGGRTVLLVPVFPGENSEQFGVERIEPGFGGVEAAMGMITDFFGHKIKRYILGQTLTSEAAATGLGSGVADAHMATFADIIKFDAVGDEETLTNDFVRHMQLWNFPKSRGIYLRFVIDTESPDAERKMNGYRQAWEMGARIKEEDVLSMIGAAMPKATDKILVNPSIAQAQQMAQMGGMQPGMPGADGGDDLQHLFGPLAGMVGDDQQTQPGQPPPDDLAGAGLAEQGGGQPQQFAQDEDPEKYANPFRRGADRRNLKSTRGQGNFAGDFADDKGITYREELHPRQPKGSGVGGRFAEKAGGPRIPSSPGQGILFSRIKEELHLAESDETPIGQAKQKALFEALAQTNIPKQQLHALLSGDDQRLHELKGQAHASGQVAQGGGHLSPQQQPGVGNGIIAQPPAQAQPTHTPEQTRQATAADKSHRDAMSAQLDVGEDEQHGLNLAARKRASSRKENAAMLPTAEQQEAARQQAQQPAQAKPARDWLAEDWGEKPKQQPAKPQTAEYVGTGDRKHGAALHPSAKNPGQWQVTRFDEDGFSGDSQYKTREQAEKEIEQDGYKPGGGLLNELAQGDRFHQGNEKTRLIGMINEGADHQTIMQAYKDGGLEAARKAEPEAKRIEAERRAKFHAANLAEEEGKLRKAEEQRDAAPGFQLEQGKAKIGRGLGAGDKTPDTSRRPQGLLLDEMHDEPGQGRFFGGEGERAKVKSEIEADKPASKEPWQMTRDEYAKTAAAIPASGGFAARANHKIAGPYHRHLVAEAHAAGKPVPPEVLKDYPDLQNQPEPQAELQAAEGKLREAEEKRDAGDFDPANHITIAADSIEQLRRSDVYRVLQAAPQGRQQQVANFIRKHRPELSGEIHDAEIDIAEESGGAKPAIGETKPAPAATEPPKGETQPAAGETPQAEGSPATHRWLAKRIWENSGTGGTYDTPKHWLEKAKKVAAANPQTTRELGDALVNFDYMKGYKIEPQEEARLSKLLETMKGRKFMDELPPKAGTINADTLYAHAQSAAASGENIWNHLKGKGIDLKDLTLGQRKQFADDASRLRDEAKPKPQPPSEARQAAMDKQQATLAAEEAKLKQAEAKRDAVENQKPPHEMTLEEFAKSQGKPASNLYLQQQHEALKKQAAKNADKHHRVLYHGKVVSMDYVSDPKDQFKRAGQRISDNIKAGEKGHIVTPKGEVFEVTRESRKARLLSGDEADKVKSQLQEQQPPFADSGKADAASQITGPYSLAHAAEHSKKMRSGEATAAEIKGWFNDWHGGQEGIKAELSTKSVAELKAMGAGGWHAAGMKKAELVKDMTEQIGDQYNVAGGLQWMMGRETKADALRRHIEKQTDQDVKDYVAKHAKYQAERKERIAGAVKSIENPETLEEFEERQKYKGGKERPMTDEQQAKYDDLKATDRRSKEAAKKSTVSGFRPGTAATGNVGIVEGHHKKRNAPTWTVTMEEHLGDNWSEALSRAKQLGGNYVNARIARAYGATPGFQFFSKEAAEKMQNVLGGKTEDRSDDVAQRKAESIENASERLAALAANTHATADEAMGRDRLTNTHKRAEQAASAEASARGQKALAETMERLSGAMKEGKAKHLEGIRSRSHVEELNAQLRRARHKRGDAEKVKDLRHDEYQAFHDKPPEAEDVKHANYPYPAIWSDQLQKHAAALKDEPGLMRLSQRLKKSATQEVKYKTQGGGFKLSGSGLLKGDVAQQLGAHGIPEGKRIRVHQSHDHRLSQQGKGNGPFYTADGGKSFGTSPEIAVSAALRHSKELDLVDMPEPELMTINDPSEIADLASAVKKLRRHSNRDLKRIGEDLQSRLDSYNRLQQMDIKSPGELRAALRDYLPLRTKAKGEDKVKTMERALIGNKIPGFFPTPAPVIERMIDAADIQPGHEVLEPSAGKGDILDALRERHPDAQHSGIEPVSSLRDIIQAKGHNLIDRDFTEHSGQYDRIVMNPPFEKGQDAQHVRHAYERLKPGGRIVAVMSAGPFFRGDNKSSEFRDWLDSVGGTVEDLPEGSFAGKDAFRQTGVNTRLVVIDKSE